MISHMTYISSEDHMISHMTYISHLIHNIHRMIPSLEYSRVPNYSRCNASLW